MAKIRTYYAPSPYDQWIIHVAHWFWDDPYEPGAYHSIYPYDFGENPPGYNCGQQVVGLKDGLITAHDWAARPAMVNDVCVWCRYHGFGANWPRWNIYRGEEHPRPSLETPPYPRHFVPGFVWDAWETLDGNDPPGYGQEP